MHTSADDREWVAYVDESLRAIPQRAGYYVLAAAVMPRSACTELRAEVAALARSPGHRFHWRLEDAPDRRKAVDLIAGLDMLHLVVVGTRLDPRRQERGRRLCLARLLQELDGAGVGQVWLEARSPILNRRDIDAVDGFRSQRLIDHALRVDHLYPSNEPLLWVPDAVAGVCRMAVEGESSYSVVLEKTLSMIEIIID